MLANSFFLLHLTGIYITTYGWIFSPYFLILHFIVISSWKLNNNKCIISQLEYYFFNKTFMGKGKKYYVPKKQRYILYLNFLIGLIYHLFLK